jgi:hypothetical protein
MPTLLLERKDKGAPTASPTTSTYRKIIVDARKRQLMLSRENVARLANTYDAAAKNVASRLLNLPSFMLDEREALLQIHLRNVLTDLDRLIVNMASDFSQVLDLSLRDLAQAAAEREDVAQQLMASSAARDYRLQASMERTVTTSTGQQFGVRFGRVAQSAVERLAGRYYTDGLTLSERIHGQILEATQKLVEDTVVQAMAAGTPARDLASSLETILSTPHVGNARYNAMRIARTEINNAYREAHIQSTREASGNLKPFISGIQWSLSLSHPRADICDCWAGYDSGLGPGIYLPEDVPIDHACGLCIRAGHIITGPEVLGSTSRWYHGEIVDIDVFGGNRLSVTPNHPVLTPRGWIAAGELTEGCDVVCCSDAERVATLVDPNDYQVPALIEDVARSCGSTREGVTRTVPTTAKDFHGDGIGSEVCIIRSNSLLRRSDNRTLTEPFSKKHLGRCNTETPSFTSQSIPALLLKGVRQPPSFFETGATSGSDLGVHRRLADADAVTRWADIDTVSQKDLCNGQSIDIIPSSNPLKGFTGLVPRYDFLLNRHKNIRATKQDLALSLIKGWGDSASNCKVSDSKFSRQTLDRLAAEISLNRVTKIRKYDFSGHVYNLHTDKGYYIAHYSTEPMDYASRHNGGIIVHNCYTASVLTDYPDVSVPSKQPDMANVPPAQIAYYAGQGDAPAIALQGAA